MEDDQPWGFKGITTMHNTSNITLIGMPGCGKTTIGVLLAKALAKDFVDTDILIQVQQQMPLQDIIDSKGYMELRKVEEHVLIDFDLHGFVVATGGSAIYSEKGILNLAKSGSIIYLDVNHNELSKRLNNYDTRGIARRPNQTFEELCAERSPLYEKHADHTINCCGKNADEICIEITALVK